MKIISIIITSLLFSQKPFSQTSSFLGQYHLVKTQRTPSGWRDFSGSARISKNNDGSVNIEGEFNIQTNEVTNLKANFNSNGCDVSPNGNSHVYECSTSGQVVVTNSESGSERHFKIIRIVIDIQDQVIKIIETNPADWRLTDWQIWAKGTKQQDSHPVPNKQSSKINIVGCALRGAAIGEESLMTSSNDAEIDRATEEEIGFLEASFLVKPAFFYYDDNDGENAFSTPSQLAGSDSEDGTICFGMGLIRREISLSINGTNVPVILAHEFGHTVARKYQVELQGKENELFADYLAGGYMFYRNLKFKTTDVEAAFRSFYHMGDNNFTDPSHHGTPQSRSTCIRKGYNDCLNAYRNNHIFTLDEGVILAKEFVTTHNLP